MVRRVILAAGHGGGDRGAVGQGTTEAAECIDIVNRAAELLRRDGQVEVIVVPHELNLQAQIDWVNARFKNLNDGICIEVHKNSFGQPAHGVEVWYYGGDPQSASYAQRVLNGLLLISGLANRGIKPDTANRHGSLGWVRLTNPWAVLAEVGFVSNGGDPVGPDANARYAVGLMRGALNVFGLAPKSVAPPAPAPAPTAPPAASQPAFRVYDGAGKQLGAYNTESGAWNKYQTGGAKIVRTRDSHDVTAEFVAKYRPAATPQPAPDAEPHPELKRLNERVGRLESIVALIYSYLSRWKRFREHEAKNK